MTEAELDLVYDLKNRFWLEFSQLCYRYLNQVPESIRKDFKMMLGEATSIYGINDDQEEKA